MKNATLSYGKALLCAAAAALLMLTLVAVPRQAQACSCVAPGTPLEEMEAKDAVFSGTVLGAIVEEPNRADGTISSADPVFATFDVDKVWKGEIEQQAQVNTVRSSASCGVDFEIGTAYIVYAKFGEDGMLHASLCSRTAPLTLAGDDLAQLGAGRTPSGPDPASNGAMPMRIDSIPIPDSGVTVGHGLALVLVRTLAVIGGWHIFAWDNIVKTFG
ncbi:hypothetical protein IDH44_21790 [Paenibacillus sp. IB182496]|uniref:Tissue inhibitor of metalloproteinase n=1 Tax=Paenibacillus sabuli TaxID=2772509 RepID=A0A927BY17_9BACL|nr:hypothetical protein [Paenibacillus sabuli]MBD2847835.1 hypothetical protein [Paenibacillus sabuli]